jgi:YVTN family beta-propeller protein
VAFPAKPKASGDAAVYFAMRSRLLILLLASTLTSSALGASRHTLVVLSHNDHTAYELDPETGRILQSFKAPDQPHESVVSADGRTVFVAVPNGPIVAILDAASFKEITRIDTPLFTRTPRLAPNAPPTAKPSTSASPHGVALNNDGSKLYVGLENADVPGVVVYDVKARKVLKKIDLLLEGGHYLAIQPGTDKLYYPHRNDNRVVVVDTKTDRIVKIIPVKGGPVGVAFAPNGDVWLHEDGDGSVTVVDSKSDEVKATIPTGGTGAGRIAVSPDGRFAASTHSGSGDVSLIDTATRKVAAIIPLGKGPGFPLFSPDSTKLYVMNSGEGDVAVIDVAAQKVSARHKVGVNPFGGAVRMTAP